MNIIILFILIIVYTSDQEISMKYDGLNYFNISFDNNNKYNIKIDPDIDDISFNYIFMKNSKFCIDNKCKLLRKKVIIDDDNYGKLYEVDFIMFKKRVNFKILLLNDDGNIYIKYSSIKLNSFMKLIYKIYNLNKNFYVKFNYDIDYLFDDNNLPTDFYKTKKIKCYIINKEINKEKILLDNKSNKIDLKLNDGHDTIDIKDLKFTIKYNYYIPFNYSFFNEKIWSYYNNISIENLKKTKNDIYGYFKFILKNNNDKELYTYTISNNKIYDYDLTNNNLLNKKLNIQKSVSNIDEIIIGLNMENSSFVYIYDDEKIQSGLFFQDNFLNVKKIRFSTKGIILIIYFGFVFIIILLFFLFKFIYKEKKKNSLVNSFIDN